MKQKISNRLLISVWLIVLILFGIFMYLNKKPMSMYQSHEDTAFEQVNDYLYIEQGCTGDEIEEIQTLVGYLPPSLFEDFINENGKVILVSDLKDDCIGTTEIREEGITIYIEEDYVFDALVHEFGHVYLHFHPMADTFKTLYETEAKSLVNAYYGDSSYYYSDEVEYFAQAFQTVLVMRGYDTQEAAPKTFDYMNELIGAMFNEK